VATQLEGQRLSRRERQVLQMAANGINSREIAKALGRAYPTIKHTFTNAQIKLGGRDRTHTVALAWQKGYIF
jgi:two-component system response regulator DesR